LLPAQDLSVRAGHGFTETAKLHQFDARVLVDHTPYFRDGDVRRLIDRVAVHPATDRRERNAAQIVFSSQLHRTPVTRGEKLRLTGASAVPDRSNGVDDMARRQIVASRNACIPGGTASEP
jgi:hypothetical protein